MNKRQLIRLGIPDGHPVKVAQRMLGKLTGSQMKGQNLKRLLAELASQPESYLTDALLGDLARALVDHAAAPAPQAVAPRETSAPWRQWGQDLDPASINQMRQACALPISMRGALMPDAHVGYGLPIGGVLAVRNAVIPYAVGVDIACRMRMTVFDQPPEALARREAALTRALMEETRFGVGASFSPRRSHRVMDEDWTFSPVLKRLKMKAWDQLGTSGSGNHFAEYGDLTVLEAGLELPPGRYLALLSHSGSRGVGNETATYYSRIATSRMTGLSGELSRLAWLDLDSDAGAEYWLAMELMGRYAAANHELIHHHITSNLGFDVVATFENHHNFAWEETHDGEPVIVHRKGATPAGQGVLGIIPGSMADPGFLVRGRGEPASLCSASHGAGRAMSRTVAKRTFRRQDMERLLQERGVKVLSAGLDEAPMAYKNILEVMSAQQDLVDILARFNPRLVRMAPAGERPED